MAGNTVVVRILGDADKLRSAFGEADKAGQSFSDKLKATGKKMQDTGKKMSIGLTAPILFAGKKVFDAASDMGESMSKVSTIFGESGDAMLAWSKTTAKSLGIPRQAALDTAGSFGNMFTQLGIGVAPAADMSKQMLTLASDFASFHNADPTAVIESMGAAFRGEFDSVQKFVPTINAAAVEQKALAMSGKDATSELTLQEKALATQALLMEGAGAATGDFARTSDSAANKQKILSAQFADAAATLGEKLLPVGQKIIEWVSGLINKFSALSPDVQKFILIGAGLLAVLGPIVAVVGTLVTVVGFLLSPIGLVVLAIAGLVAGFIWAYRNVEWFRDGVDAVLRFIADAAGWLGRVFSNVWDGIVGGFRWVRDTLKSIANWLISNVINKFIDGINLLIKGYNTVNIGGKDLPMLGKLPTFHQGGVIPGPVGTEVAILAQAGETVVPIGGNASGGNTVINIAFNGVTTRETAYQVIGIIEQHFGRGGALGNGRGGTLVPR